MIRLGTLIYDFALMAGPDIYHAVFSSIMDNHHTNLDDIKEAVLNGIKPFLRRLDIQRQYPWSNGLYDLIKMEQTPFDKYIYPDWTKEHIKQYLEIQGHQTADSEVSQFVRELCANIYTELHSNRNTSYFIEETELELRKIKDKRRDDELSELRSSIQQLSSLITKGCIKTDNKRYLDDFSKPLFEEKDTKNGVSLVDVYISPSVSNKSKTASEIINNWYSTDTDHPVLLMCGKAGVGKSTLCQKILTDAVTRKRSTNLKTEFTIDLDKIHVIALRNQIDVIKEIRSIISIEAFINRLFNIRNDSLEYNERKPDLFVLDGLDELVVLFPEFNIDDFINKLNLYYQSGVKILITSRPSKILSDKSTSKKHILFETLEWKNDDVGKWCSLYSQANNEKDLLPWINSFLSYFNDLPGATDKDDRKNILKIPVILYIACCSRIDINDTLSIGQIYDKAFRKILERKHQKGCIAGEVFTGEAAAQDQNNNKLYWRFTKEIAYQMFLNNEPSLSVNSQSKAWKNALKRTQDLCEITLELEDNNIDTIKYLGLFYMADETDNRTGITFVHRTVYEYFTAIKLYEDYLYFDENQTDNLDEVWKSLCEAFRYKQINISDEIMSYLIDFHNHKLSDKISKAFINGLILQKIISIPLQTQPIPEYESPYINMLPSDQTTVIFRNLSRFMTGCGFNNQFIDNTTEEFRELFSIIFRFLCSFDRYFVHTQITPDLLLQNTTQEKTKDTITSNNQTFLSLDSLSKDLFTIDISNWLMSNLYLNNIIIRYLKCCGTIFNKSDLNKAVIYYSNLSRAQLNNAQLRQVQIIGSDLIGASFKNSDLHDASISDSLINGAHFEEADLRGANLEATYGIKSAFFNKALYNNDTIFPNGFNFEQAGMIFKP